MSCFSQKQRASEEAGMNPFSGTPLKTRNWITPPVGLKLSGSSLRFHICDLLWLKEPPRHLLCLNAVNMLNWVRAERGGEEGQIAPHSQVETKPHIPHFHCQVFIFAVTGGQGQVANYCSCPVSVPSHLLGSGHSRSFLVLWSSQTEAESWVELRSSKLLNSSPGLSQNHCSQINLVMWRV